MAVRITPNADGRVSEVARIGDDRVTLDLKRDLLLSFHTIEEERCNYRAFGTGHANAVNALLPLPAGRTDGDVLTVPAHRCRPLCRLVERYVNEGAPALG